MGFARESLGICSKVEINLKKKNFYITRQLVTLNAASYCDSLGYSGDSFQNTRHPLITLSFPDFGLQFLVVIKLDLLTLY